MFVILGHFLPFQPLDNLENQNFKLKKTPGDIITLYICTINDNHMMYGSWGMEHNRHNFLSFWNVFCPFTTLWTQKTKILKNQKKMLENIIFLHNCTKSHDHMLYCSLGMVHNGCNCYFSFWTIFWPFISLRAWKIKIKKKSNKKPWRYHHFTIVYQKSWS